MTQNPSNMALSFEAEKVSESNHASGRKFGIKTKPGAAPTAFIEAAIGSRWMISIVRLDENDAPCPAKQESDNKAPQSMWDAPAPKQAALLCNWPVFQDHLNELSDIIVHDKDTAKAAIYQLFSIDSRAELRFVPVLNDWTQFVREFREKLDDDRYGDNLSR